MPTRENFRGHDVGTAIFRLIFNQNHQLSRNVIKLRKTEIKDKFKTYLLSLFLYIDKLRIKSDVLGRR